MAHCAAVEKCTSALSEKYLKTLPADQVMVSYSASHFPAAQQIVDSILDSSSTPGQLCRLATSPGRASGHSKGKV